jgi:uncharacterized membrane protein (UPF0127 family)
MRHLVISFLLVFGLVSSAFAEEITGPQPTLPLSRLVVDTAKGPVRFTVEMATDWPQQERGLMFRKTLGPNAGMLFDFGKEQEEAFWMKNTLIPLDMLFIKADGRIARIAANAKPLSEVSIPSYEPVRAVLEIAGGRAAELGMKAGDRVENPIFKRPAPEPR